jgi:hypothetical protein
MIGSSMFLRRNPKVLSDTNLSFFLMWAANADPRDLTTIMENIYIVNHRLDPTWGIDGSHPMIIKNLTMPERSCTDNMCIRCRQGRGGYRFDWVGPWTHRDILVPEGTDPGEHRRQTTMTLPPHLPRSYQETAMDIICPEAIATQIVSGVGEQLQQKDYPSIMIITTDSEDDTPPNITKVKPSSLCPIQKIMDPPEVPVPESTSRRQRQRTTGRNSTTETSTAGSSRDCESTVQPSPILPVATDTQEIAEIVEIMDIEDDSWAMINSRAQ